MARTAKLCKASERVPKKITWLWENWLAEGMVHILAGKPGVGKSTIALTVAAIVSRGGKWPDGTQSPVGDAVIWSGEDDIAKTIKPRLAKAGADMDRIHIVAGISDKINERRPFDLSRDMGTLCGEIERMSNLKLVILDPIFEKDYPAFRTLASLANNQNFAVLGIACFSKNTLAKDLLCKINSMAIETKAQVVWVAAENKGKQHVL